MKKIFLVAILFIISNLSFASHIVGGDISVKYISPNNFEVTLRFYRDCLNGTANFDDPIILGLFDKVTNASVSTISIPLVSKNTLSLGDTCFTPTGLCVEEGIFKTNITLADNPNGYYLSWQRCCRNNVIDNIVSSGSAGVVFYVEIPDPAIKNSSPLFGTYPNAYFCSGVLTTQNFSCTDADGDQLVYSLITPLNGNATTVNNTPPPSAGPYSSITWQTPYSNANMIGGTPAISINPSTGILTAKPAALGIFVFAVRVEEYRSGVKIGEIRRDIQYQVLNCPANQPTTFDQSNATILPSYKIIAGDQLCIPVKAENPNGDWITLKASSPELFRGSSTVPTATFTGDSAKSFVQSDLCITTTCDHIREAPYHVTFYVKDSNCYGNNTIKKEVDFFVASPIEGGIDSNIPNIFTPNGDGVNDFFRINVKIVNFCFDKFNTAIYNRWGQKVYESSDFYFQWDGKMLNGSKANDGIYYYIIDATFKDKESNYKGAVQLLR